MKIRRTVALGWLAVLLLSLTTVAEAQSTEELGSDLQEIFDGYRWGDAQWSALVTSLDTGDTIFAIAPDAPLAPASNVKLLTTAAALHLLGPDFRFRTWLLSEADIDDGVLLGDLVIYGTGDPGISDRFYRSKDEVFQRLADQLETAGIHTVTGDLVADASYFDGPLRDEGWDSRDLNEHFTAGISALSYNENVVSFRIRPGEPGEPPLVETVPPHSALVVENAAETVTGQARPRLAILRDDPLEPVRIVGRLRVGARDVWRQMTVAVPADFVAASLRATLEERGIVVEGGDRSVVRGGFSTVPKLAAPALGRPGPRILATHESRPLIDYLHVVNKESHNLLAELIFRTMGRVTEGEGTPQAAATAVLRTLHEIGVDTTNLVQRDGSGLSGRNRIPAGAFVQTVEAMSDGPLWGEYWATLPRAGTRYELGRMYRTAAAGNLRAKTGTIRGVSALSGMVRSRDGERLAFSLIVNDSPSQTRAKRLENQVGVRLAEFKRPDGQVPPLVSDGRDDTPVRSTAFSDRHRVSRGESLSTIALRYGVSVDDILDVNPRMEANRIIAGQWLELPRRGGGGP
ncbi:MAG: D-alanyl-D-alanine carboxypeptidase/D-alanyl-D-alanine-endopeptidase [Gemmatimonadetes bacterium]|nr:D-alanyl-D-alanine carboxypeptidase/D-alanyl-D-alanine-endopeptidase [Gemmatimonadota bacterium]NNF13579.1 D-alanyl-D-alanine carboxypeptidase/D-alanyl-D-alanine-endopeptidase [Gemmatimonadota bacterium]NNL29794.1 D-alanyl-D-alanine carboxypeptidase/D-alanyl-D-alanine-endopeptidase [Gemmatimonadota bacterium]